VSWFFVKKQQHFSLQRLHERHAFVPCGRIGNVARKLGKVLALIMMQKQLD
jgi:L-amino acid N-acyltransferase YncA